MRSTFHLELNNHVILAGFEAGACHFIVIDVRTHGQQERTAIRNSLEKNQKPSKAKEIDLETDNAEHSVQDLIEPRTTQAIELDTDSAEHGADLSAATVAEKVPGVTSDNSKRGAPQTTAAKKQSCKRKRTVVEDTDIEEDNDNDEKPVQ